MSQTRRSQQWHTYVSSDSPSSGGLKVRELRDFVHALTDAGIDDSELVTAHFANDTRHLIRLSVSATREEKE